MRRILVLLPLFFVGAEIAFGGTGTVANATQGFWTEAKGFVEGPGGALLALGAVGWGVYSFIRGSIFLGIVGILGGLGIYNLPGIIDGLFTFTV